MASTPFVPQRRTQLVVGDDEDSPFNAAQDEASAAGDPADWRDFGMLAPYLADPAVTDLFVNGVDGLWIDDGTGLRRARDPERHVDEEVDRDLAEVFEDEYGFDAVLSTNAAGAGTGTGVPGDGTGTGVSVPGAGGFEADSDGIDDEAGSDELGDERALRALAVRLIALGGRHIDETSPCVDVRLRDGIRVHAVLPPISTTGTLLSIRIPRRERFRLGDLAASGMVSTAQADRLRLAIRRRENILVTGAAGTGKTTLLAALLAEAPPGERIVAIEDVAELRVDHPHFVSLESRQANLEGAGAIGMERLVREALRMRPDRLVLGECRGAEIRELLAALNTGHDGGAGTLHANSLADVPARVEALGALAQMSQEAVARQTVSAIGVIVHLERTAGIRRLAGIGGFALDARGRLQVIDE